MRLTVRGQPVDPLLTAQGLSFRFPAGPTPAIDRVDLSVYPGETYVLVGPSGCGKTTTLRALLGLERATGTVRLEDRVLQDDTTFLPPEKRGIGLVFQDYALFPHLSVLKNVLFGVQKVSRREALNRAREALWDVGLSECTERTPDALSGGQQQRVALARVIAARQKVLLLDEPFSSLDPGTRQSARELIRRIATQRGIGVVMVTHDQEEALSTADELGVMCDGRLLQSGQPEAVYNRPSSPFVADFLGRTNLLRGEAFGAYAETVLGRLSINEETIGPVTLSLRPEHIAVGEGPVTGTIINRQFKGHDLTYVIRVGQRDVTVQTDYQVGAEVGESVGLAARSPATVVGRG